nr:hypothetical protein [Kibdelosporangium sp. MJ126-NF4]
MLYPDIAEATSLQIALQREFNHLGHQLTALPARDAPGWRFVGARVEDAHRHTSVVMGILERVFTMEFWAARVHMASGNTADLRAVAGAIRIWQSGSPVRTLNSEWPFVHFSPLAEAHERGEAAEFTWQQYLDNPKNAPQLLRLNSFIATAIREPRLRALFPFTSMDTLGFSQTPGYPHSGGCPWVTPLDDGRYLITTSDGHELGTADAAGSVAHVLAALDAQPTITPVQNRQT